MDESRINELKIVPGSISSKTGKLNLNFSLIGKSNCAFKIDTQMKTIKIFDSLIIYYYSDYYFATLMPKLDLSRTKEIKIGIKVELKRENLERILQPTLEKIHLYCSPSKNANPALMAFQRCPKMKHVEIKYLEHPTIPILTKSALKEILLTKRETKIKQFHFDPVIEFDQDDFMELLDNHLDSNCVVNLRTHSSETFNAVKEMCIKIKEIRQNELKNSNIRIEIFFGISGCFFAIYL
uniref:Uncharacterized protein n=1 Tax=Panagrolaimus sp. PS1159 TaxID=55785 RepID=A0AC35FIR5_9BILA